MTHLPLETCRELKEAGYLQETVWRVGLTVTGDVTLIRSGDSLSFSNGSPAYSDVSACPTSDELLETLGDGFSALYESDSQFGEWAVSGFYADGAKTMDYGNTPAEALARLYISVNSKK